MHFKITFVKSINFFFFIFFLIIILSCVKQPNYPDDNNISVDTLEGAYILCEGLWHYDNSSLSRYNFIDKSVINDFFSKSNPGFKLGDLANFIFLYKDFAYIAVSTAQTIECINIKSGKSIGRLKINGNRQPREIFIFNDSLGYITDLYTHSVICFNPTKLEIIKTDILCGPAPEGISSFGNYLYVANSGYGDYLANEPKAGTISIIDLFSNKEINNIYCGPNTCEVIVNAKRNTFYGVYYHLPSKLDSIGGIIEFDLKSNYILREWKINAYNVLITPGGDTLLFLNTKGVFLIDLNTNTEPELLIRNKNNLEHWYALAFCPKDNTVWVGNAKNYQMNGEILIFNLKNTEYPINRFTVGVNPAQIVFF